MHAAYRLVQMLRRALKRSKPLFEQSKFLVPQVCHEITPDITVVLDIVITHTTTYNPFRETIFYQSILHKIRIW